MLKAFFHGRGRHSKGWDGSVLCGEVTSIDDVFDKSTYKNFSGLVNYSVSRKKAPTTEELDDLVAVMSARHLDLLNNPPEEIEPAEITKLKELGILEADSKKKSILELTDKDMKFKKKTAPMAKLESIDAIVEGSTETNVDDYVENQLTEEEQIEVALKVKEIKDKRVK